MLHALAEHGSEVEGVKNVLKREGREAEGA